MIGQSTTFGDLIAFAAVALLVIVAGCALLQTIGDLVP